MVRQIKFSFDQMIIVLLISLLLFVVASIGLDGFFAIGNILTLIRSISILGILALGMGIVVIGRGMDFSLIANMAVWITWAAELGKKGYPFTLILLAGFCFCIIVCLIMGFLITYAEVPAIFATLAMGLVVYGFGKAYLFNLDVNVLPPGISWMNFIGRGDVLGLPMPIVAYAVISLLVYIFLRKTNIGTFIYAIGDKHLASRISGIPARPVVIGQYVIAGVLAFIAGIVSAGSIQSINARIFNSTLIYDVLLVVVVGGISLTGGRGGVINIWVGAFLIGILNNAMTILDIDYTIQNIVKGVVLLIALTSDSLINPREEQTAQQGDI